MIGTREKSIPLVSVLMPVRNSNKTLEQAISSVLNQTLSNFELIVIDDKSEDDSWEIIRKFALLDKRIRAFRNHKNLQIARTLNNGVKLCRSGFIARMDADDWAYPERLSLQYKFLKKNPMVGIVGGNIEISDQNGKVFSTRSYPTSSDKLKKMFFRYSPFAHPVIMFKKRVFESCNGFDPSMVPAEDIDLWLRMSKNCEFGSIDQTLLKYRISSTSNSNFNLYRVERLTFMVRLKAIKLGYFPSISDIVYNIIQLSTIWITPPVVRVNLYNYLRSRKLI